MSFRAQSFGQEVSLKATSSQSNTETSPASSGVMHSVNDDENVDAVDVSVGANVNRFKGKGMNRTKSVFSMGSDLSIISEDDSFSADSGGQGSVDSSTCPPIIPERLLGGSSRTVNYAHANSSEFGALVRCATHGRPEAPVFDGELRRRMEPFLRPVRERRTVLFHELLARGGHGYAPSSGVSMISSSVESRYTLSSLSSNPLANSLIHGSTWLGASITPSLGVPYTELRTERPFLFDHEHSYPLHQLLANAIDVPFLDRIHEHEHCDRILDTLRDPQRRQPFHEAYDSFVTSFCVPLLHSMAMSNSLLHSGFSDENDDRIVYRYQAFPTIVVHVPGGSTARYGCSASPLSCGVLEGHSVACLTFHIPLTPSFGTNAMYVESHPGKEDWHPLQTKSEGMGFLFDGARCFSFLVDNTTSATSVFLNFQVLFYRESVIRGRYGRPSSQSGLATNTVGIGSNSLRATSLCPSHLLEDRFSQSTGSTFYDEASISSRSSQFRTDVPMVSKCRTTLLAVDSRCGPPFHMGSDVVASLA
jgi:hypothetical protein